MEDADRSVVANPAVEGAPALIAWSSVHGIASILVRQGLVSPVSSDNALDAVLDAVERAVETL